MVVIIAEAFDLVTAAALPPPPPAGKRIITTTDACITLTDCIHGRMDGLESSVIYLPFPADWSNSVE